MAGGGKTTKARRKNDLKRIENDESRMICFSKRRSGICKKASELVTLCGAEVGFLVFSPARRLFSFGHPSVEAVIDRFLNQNQPLVQDTTHPIVEVHRRLRIRDLNQQYIEVMAQLEAERKRYKELVQLRASCEEGLPGWWECPVDAFDAEKLQELTGTTEEMKNNFWNKLNERARVGASSSASHGGLMDANGQAQMMVGDGYVAGNVNELAFPSGFVHPGFSHGGQAPLWTSTTIEVRNSLAKSAPNL